MRYRGIWRLPLGLRTTGREPNLGGDFGTSMVSNMPTETCFLDLPLHAHHLILVHGSLVSMSTLARACSTLALACVSLPDISHQLWLLRQLQLPYKGAYWHQAGNRWIATTLSEVLCHPSSISSHGCWKDVLRETQEMWGELASCPSPAEHKALRWMLSKPADHPLVRRTIIGASMLPSTVLGTHARAHTSA